MNKLINKFLATSLLLFTMCFTLATENTWVFYMDSYIDEDLKFETIYKQETTTYYSTWSCDADKAYKYSLKNASANPTLPLTLRNPSVPSGKKVIFLAPTEIYSFQGAVAPTFVIEEVGNEIHITRFDVSR